jgi:hypothetical protein
MKNGFVRLVNRRSRFAARPAAGQKQRPGSGTWEEATNRHQRKLVEIYDRWSLELKRGIRKLADVGAGIPKMCSFLDGQIPVLERRLSEIQAAGIVSAVKVSAKSRANFPAVKELAERLIQENRTLIRENLIPQIHEKMTLSLALGAGTNPIDLKTIINAARVMPAAYSGGYWVAIFEVQKGLGEMREQERRNSGLPIEAVRWILDPAAEHCRDSEGGYYGCPSLAGEYPNGWSSLPTVPAGQVSCRGNCRCHLEVFRDGAWRRGVYDD